MGIKGIYAQLGPGQRVSLSKLTADSFRDNGRPLRLAIDFAIWQFQNQAARGGTNPALRTLFYRLTRLMRTPVQPIFVFDGPHKPAFKRNKRSGRGDGVAVGQAKKLIRLFGFPIHDAPGEAEAECALMQKRGIVDAVLSEDVDTIMFGCRRTLRNWSSESKSSKDPTHVSLYDVGAMRLAELGLDREGMVLVALMSGGDYLPDGIPGCGVKVACEAAKAGYGKRICRLKASDKEGIREWRESLMHELSTNESKHFRTKHKALAIPEDFPNLEVLRYYTHPVVSPESTMETLGQKLDQEQDLQLDALREFSRDTFSWDFRIGAIKFIRVLGTALLVRNMWRGLADDGLIQRISGRRTHFSADGEPELRLSYVPQEVVPIDISQEVDEEIAVSRDGLALNSDDEMDDSETVSSSQPVKIFDVTKADLAWILEDVVKRTSPGAFAAWQEAEEAKAARKKPGTKRKTTKTKAVSGKAASATGMPRGAMEKFVRVTKTWPLEAAKLQETTAAKTPASHPPIDIPSSPGPVREQSKPPTSSAPSDAHQHHPPDPRTGYSSHVAPTRTRKPAAAARETIIISSSPPAEASTSASSQQPPPTPTRRSRATPSGSQEVSGSVRASVTPNKASGKMMPRATTKPASKGKKSDSGYKQTSMDMYTLRSDPFASSPPTRSSPPPPPVSDDDDSDDDLPPLLGPSSPTKKQRKNDAPSTDPGWDDTPAKPDEKKKKKKKKKRILMPRSSAVGFFKEVEVDADTIEEVTSQEERLSGQKRVAARLSDLVYIDLTET